MHLLIIAGSLEMRKSNSLTWGLYNTNPKYPIYFIKNTIKDFFIMLKRIPYVIRHGYYPQATFETYAYMIDIWKDILTWYRNNRSGTEIVIDLLDGNSVNHDWYAENEKTYNEKLDKMLAELDIMAIDPLDCIDGYEAGDIKRQKAAERFFNIFKDLFFGLWD